jgi:hypothetical protein
MQAVMNECTTMQKSWLESKTVYSIMFFWLCKVRIAAGHTTAGLLVLLFCCHVSNDDIVV